MKKHAQIYTLFLMFVFCAPSKGQNKTDLPKDNINSESKKVVTSHGSNSIVRTIKQDRKGNIWIASWEGIFRYDGKSFTNITSKVSSARFFSVLEDRKGNFWFASVGSGVYYYDGKSFRNYTTKDGLVSDAVIAIYEDKAGNIWFGGQGGASRFDGKSFRNYIMNRDSVIEEGTGKSYLNFITGEGPPHKDHNDVNWIFEDKTGKFWFGTRGYISVYDGKTFTTLTNKDGKAFKNVWCIIEDKKGNIWLSADDGLWRYDGSTFTNFTQRSVLSIIEDKKGNIWASSIGGANNGLFCYDGKSFSNEKSTVTEIKSPKAGVFVFFEANDGSIWLGTTSGVYLYDGKTFEDFKD